MPTRARVHILPAFARRTANAPPLFWVSMPAAAHFGDVYACTSAAGGVSQRAQGEASSPNHGRDSCLEKNTAVDEFPLTGTRAYWELFGVDASLCWIERSPMDSVGWWVLAISLIMLGVIGTFVPVLLGAALTGTRHFWARGDCPEICQADRLTSALPR
jgi:hypothetical protein